MDVIFSSPSVQNPSQSSSEGGLRSIIEPSKTSSRTERVPQLGLERGYRTLSAEHNGTLERVGHAVLRSVIGPFQWLTSRVFRHRQ